VAKPFKRAAPVCLLLTIVALAGAVIGVLRSDPLVVIACLVPTVIYEVYRTEGVSTKWASWVLLLVLVAEIVLIVGDISVNVADILGSTQKTVAGYTVPLGDVKIVAPAIMAVLAVILFTRTRGRYTRWLAAIIFLGAFAIIYVLDPTIFATVVRFGIEEGLEKVR